MKTEKILHIPYSEFTEMERIIKVQKETINKLGSGMPFIKVDVRDSYDYRCLGRVAEYLTNEEFQKEFGYIPDKLNDLEERVIEIADLKESCARLRRNVNELENELEENSLLRHKTFGIPTLGAMMFLSGIATCLLISVLRDLELFTN